MIPRLHPKGHSFKGAAAYLLHDKKADTSERVAWTETRNLATDRADIAWRVMAATALSQDYLKANAGIKNTGRKSSAHVLHFSLSWTEQETKGLTRDEMMRAAHGALRALGATEHQALIVSHNDEPHGHVHILLNRVSPEDGRMLSSSKEKLVLSQWAETYEKERGEILCEERVINNAARKRKQFTRSKDQSRIAYESAHQASNDNGKDLAARRSELAKRRRDQQARHVTALQTLRTGQKARLTGIAEQAKQTLFTKQRAIRDQYRSRWTELFHEHQAEQRVYEQRERKLLGRADNALRAVDFGAILRSGERRAALGRAFRVFSSSGARLEELKRGQARQARELAVTQKREERAAAAEIMQERSHSLTEAKKQFLAERNSLLDAHSAERTALKNAWRSLPRMRAVRPLDPVLSGRNRNTQPTIRPEFNEAAQAADNRTSETDQSDLHSRLARRFGKSNAKSRQRGREDHER